MRHRGQLLPARTPCLGREVVGFSSLHTEYTRLVSTSAAEICSDRSHDPTTQVFEASIGSQSPPFEREFPVQSFPAEFFQLRWIGEGHASLNLLPRVVEFVYRGKTQ